MENEDVALPLTITGILSHSIPVSINYLIDYIPMTFTLIIMNSENENSSKEQAILTLGVSYLIYGFGHLVAI